MPHGCVRVVFALSMILLKVAVGRDDEGVLVCHVLEVDAISVTVRCCEELSDICKKFALANSRGPAARWVVIHVRATRWLEAVPQSCQLGDRELTDVVAGEELSRPTRWWPILQRVATGGRAHLRASRLE